MRIARQIPWLPLFALLFALGIVIYAVFHGGSSTPASQVTTQAFPLNTTDSSAVLFTSPANLSTVSNPVTVSVAIGGGLRFQPDSETPAANLGHLHILIDTPVPNPGETIPSDATHINLGDGSHETTLPTLTPGDHTLRAVWTDAANKTGPDFVYSHTIVITVAPPAT